MEHLIDDLAPVRVQHGGLMILNVSGSPPSRSEVDTEIA
jgi:hypothetical protein